MALEAHGDADISSGDAPFTSPRLVALAAAAAAARPCAGRTEARAQARPLDLVGLPNIVCAWRRHELCPAAWRAW